MADNDVTFTADERAYLDNGGDVPAPSEETPKVEAATDEVEIDFEDEKAAPKEEKQDEKPKLVPHQALHAERLKRQETERLLAEQRQQFARFEERMAQLNEIMAKPQPQVPDPVQDPIGALQYTQAQLQEMQQRQEREQQQRQQQYQEQQVLQQIDNTFVTSVRSREAVDPSFSADVNLVNNSLAGYIANWHGITDPAELNEAVAVEQRRLAYRAMRQGVDVADVIKLQAKALREQARAAFGENQPAQAPAQQTIENKQKGLAAARSLSNAGGSTSDTMLTPDRISNMSSEDFAALKAKLSPSKFAKLMGSA